MAPMTSLEIAAEAKAIAEGFERKPWGVMRREVQAVNDDIAKLARLIEALAENQWALAGGQRRVNP